MANCSECGVELAPNKTHTVRGKVCCKKCRPDLQEAYRQHLQQQARTVLVSTTEALEGHRIVGYLGPVCAAVMRRLNAFEDLAGDLWDVVGISDYDERRLMDLHAEAERRLRLAAADRGCQAVVATRFDAEYVESVDPRGIIETRDRKLLVTAVGTAVKVERLTHG